MNQFRQFQNALFLEVISKNTYSKLTLIQILCWKNSTWRLFKCLMHKALISILPHSVAISSSIQYLNRIEAKDIILEVEIFKVSRGSSSGSG